MQLEKQCTSLEISKRLMELSVPQESLFNWCGACGRVEDKQKDEPCPTMSGRIDPSPHYFISAFTVAELGEILTKRFNPLSSKTESLPVFVGKWIWYENGKAIVEADTEADARGKCLIYLLENKLIEL